VCTQVGPYRLVRELGRGGMGVVFEAVDDALDRRVALKLITPELAALPGFRERFRREARAQASLDSPHVVTVFAHGEIDGRLFIATQLVPDGDLGALLRERGPLPVSVAADLVRQVASGLAEAHSAGLVHRDVKPANVLLRLRRDGISAYLTDFGIACRVGAMGAPRSLATGTPSYMAPELVAGATPAPSSDVYSLGCLLRAALGPGRRSRRLDRILRSALATDPAERFPDAGAVRDELCGLTRRRTPYVAAAVAVGVTGAVVVGGFLPAGRGGGTDGGSERPDVTAAISAALAADGTIRRPAADCVARYLVGVRGVDGLVDAGLLDADHRVRTTDSDGLDPSVLGDLVAAGRSCILGGPSGQRSAMRTSPARVATYAVPSGPR
jgi:serine/threonine-protein kinase